MATEQQIHANRANAQKSTGPRTEEGKKRASLNALKHGMTCQTIILPGEDPSHFAKLLQDFRQDLAPIGALEDALVETLAQTQWSLFRMRANENNLGAIGHAQIAHTFNSADLTIQTALAQAQIMKLEMETYKGASLYLQRNSSMFKNTLKQLQDLQATRKAAEKEELEKMAYLADHLKTHNLPFDQTYFGSVCSPEELKFLRRMRRALRTPTPPYPPESPLANVA